MYRVYKVDDTPLDGCDDYFDVGSQKMAIKLTRYLNELTQENNDLTSTWVWA
tara:strand:- start:3 stop:158 length:156 start_codon:yes stop_codon:yes gene_type:complete